MGFLKKEKSKAPLRSAVLLSVASAFGLGYYQGAESAFTMHNQKVAEAELNAYSRGKRDQDWKHLIRTDQDVFNKACYTWWFDSTVKDRQIKVLK